mmetsp:Transcript_35568/g.96445  ORF Transcript_35568/g.96445 Transcript_35568/m.96445 type:complete len:334 (-) Transcript_35568:133-1134(-)
MLLASTRGFFAAEASALRPAPASSSGSLKKAAMAAKTVGGGPAGVPSLAAGGASAPSRCMALAVASPAVARGRCKKLMATSMSSCTDMAPRTGGPTSTMKGSRLPGSSCVPWTSGTLLTSRIAKTSSPLPASAQAAASGVATCRGAPVLLLSAGSLKSTAPHLPNTALNSQWPTTSTTAALHCLPKLGSDMSRSRSSKVLSSAALTKAGMQFSAGSMLRLRRTVIGSCRQQSSVTLGSGSAAAWQSKRANRARWPESEKTPCVGKRMLSALETLRKSFTSTFRATLCPVVLGWMTESMISLWLFWSSWWSLTLSAFACSCSSRYACCAAWTSA